MLQRWLSGRSLLNMMALPQPNKHDWIEKGPFIMLEYKAGEDPFAGKVMIRYMMLLSATRNQRWHHIMVAKQPGLQHFLRGGRQW